MSASPEPTASKVSNARTNAPAGKTSTLIRPPLACSMVRAMRTALVCKPGMSAGQSVTSLSWRIPCVIAGAGKLAPAANDPAPAKTSHGCPLAARSLGLGSGTRFAGPHFPWDAPAFGSSSLLQQQALRGEQQRKILPHRLNEDSIVHHGTMAAPMTVLGQTSCRP